MSYEINTFNFDKELKNMLEKGYTENYLGNRLSPEELKNFYDLIIEAWSKELKQIGTLQ